MGGSQKHKHTPPAKKEPNVYLVHIFSVKRLSVNYREEMHINSNPWFSMNQHNSMKMCKHEISLNVKIA